MTHANVPAAPPDRAPFLITIDTEGDNLWSRPREITTRNSRYLPRFQTLCEKFGFKPVYLTNYEMARCPEFVPFARDGLRRGVLEIGMHLHAWNSPPLAPLTADDFACQPYLIEYPAAILREKVAFLTALLEDTFGVKMLSHRAGRWAMDAVYADALIEHGYRIDCSVTPRISWREHKGDPAREGGSDYSDFPGEAYRVDGNDLRREGKSPLLEVPMTILSFEAPWTARCRSLLPPASLPARALRRFFPPAVWFRPDGSNLSTMLRVMRRIAAARGPYIEFMLHSSEFMPGGSPVFPGEADIEKLYDDLEALFEASSAHFRGATLAEFERAWSV
jgi:hypothetical protein